MAGVAWIVILSMWIVPLAMLATDDYEQTMFVQMAVMLVGILLIGVSVAITYS